jgi:hypothetical protein
MIQMPVNIVVLSMDCLLLPISYGDTEKQVDERVGRLADLATLGLLLYL